MYSQKGWRIAFVVGTVVVVALSLTPAEYLPTAPVWDKLVHFLVYAVLALCGCRGFQGARLTLGVSIALVVIGGGLEVVQAEVVPGRSGDLFDACANLAGVALGVVVAGYLRGRRKVRIDGAQSSRSG
ncbi:MAG: VanZ family protein [Candidatus Binatia bacterium]